MEIELTLESAREDAQGVVLEWELFFVAAGTRVGPLRSPARCVPGIGMEEPWSGGIADPRLATDVALERATWPDPLQVGQEFGGVVRTANDTVTRTYRVASEEQIETPIGRRDGYRVSMREESATGGHDATLWVATGVGLVRGEYARAQGPLRIDLVSASDP